jgi:ATP/ADP translocase/HEAT repeat protein/CRP-like cAMP-binding protein
MFAYSFLAMAGYNMIKPVTRGLFIEKLGAENLPWVQFGAGIAIGLIMQGYTRAMALVPRRWMVPITLAAITGGMAAFYVFFVGLPASKSVAVGFYLFGLIIGILLISQFWTLANDIYDPRQAKRIFGFVGAGSSLGGFAGAMTTSSIVERVGANAMLLVSAATLAACTAAVAVVIRREPAAGRSDASRTGEDGGVGGAEAWRLLTSSRHLQLISMVIAFAAICAAIIEQQINMATAEAKGAANVDAVTAFLAQITAYLSLIGFVVQLALTSRIHRALGIGFALMILPVADAATGVLMLMGGALWTAGVARVVDTSLRYTVDKTTREVLFLPLPVDIKYRAKPFIDVTVDRFAKGLGALLLLVLVQRWGLALGWQQLSYASLTIVALWAVFALSARRQYLQAFRRSIEQRQVETSDVSLAQADPASVETLVGELAHHEPRRVLYAIDLLEGMDKRALITPLLLHHEAPEVRARALRVASGAGPELAERWLPGVRRAFADPDYGVRRAAVPALAALSGSSAVDVMRPYLTSTDPSLAISAAGVLASSPRDADVVDARRRLRRFAADTREEAAGARRQVAQVLGDLRAAEFRALLVPLMYDADIDVARAAIESAGRLGADDFLLVPPLVTLLRHRRLKAAARKVLVGYGEGVVAPLAHFMHDADEDRWVRRHIPSTLAELPCQASVDALVKALEEPDGFLRYKAMAALGRIRRSHPHLAIDRAAVTRQIVADAGRAFGALTLDHNLFVRGHVDAACLLARALQEKHERAVSRVFDLLALVHPADAVSAVRYALLHADARQRSGAIEYCDNLLAGEVRKRVMLLIEEMPLDERVRRGNVLYRTRPRDVEDTLAQLVHDDDPSIAAAAIQLVERLALWSLAGDLEHVLAHRDVRDWQVFEAASWALAAQRMPAERRRALWQEPLPAVEVADRLRRVPLFEFASVDELLRLGGAGRQMRHEAGRVLFMRGAAAPEVHVLLDGQVSMTASSGTTVAEAPLALGLQEVLEGAAMRSTVTTAGAAITLTLTPDELLTLLSEHAGLTVGLFRWIIALNGAGAPVVSGHADAALVARVLRSGAVADRALLLHANPLFARATAAQLWRLAAIARPTSLAAGDRAFGRGGAAAMVIVLDGELAVDRPGAERQLARPGDIVGMYETLAGLDVTAKVVASVDTRVLRIDGAELFDLIADHTDLLQGVFAGLVGG